MSIIIPTKVTKVRRNSVKAEFYSEEDKLAVINQIEKQLVDVLEADQSEGIKRHFIFLLANDFYKDALSAETISEIESHLPEDWEDEIIDWQR